MGICICSEGDRLDLLKKSFDIYNIPYFDNIYMDDYESQLLLSVIDMGASKSNDLFCRIRMDNLTYSKHFHMATFLIPDENGQTYNKFDGYGLLYSVNKLASFFEKDLIEDIIIPMEELLEQKKSLGDRNNIRHGLRGVFSMGGI